MKQPLFFCVGASHKTMAIEMREGLALSDESITRLLPEVCRKFNLQEALLLSTCNRLEMVGVLTRDISHSDELKHVLASVHETFANILHTNKLADVVYSYLDLDAVRHIFSVVASLDSLIVGETQITGQFKKALELAQGCKTVGPLLRRLSQDALANAKKIRAQTDIGRKPVSISHAAVDLTKRVFSNVSDCSFLIIGAGDMGALAARYALSYKPKQLFVANRTKLKAERLVDQLGFGHASDLGNIEWLMGQADVVICATGAPGFLIEKSAVAAILPHKRSKPLLLIDIALPRDIDPACGSFENVYLFDIDDLRVVVDSHIEERKLAARKAHLIIEENLNGVETWLRRTDINPVIANFRSYVDDILARESQKTMSRQIFQNLTEEQRDALQQLLHTISDRLTSDAGSRIRSLESPHLARARALGLLELFPLENFENQNGKK